MTNHASAENVKIPVPYEELADKTLFVKSSTIVQDANVPNVTRDPHSYVASSIPIVDHRLHLSLLKDANPTKTVLTIRIAKRTSVCASPLAVQPPYVRLTNVAWPLFIKHRVNASPSWLSMLPENSPVQAVKKLVSVIVLVHPIWHVSINYVKPRVTTKLVQKAKHAAF